MLARQTRLKTWRDRLAMGGRSALLFDRFRRRWRIVLVLVLIWVFILGVPSIPPLRYHLAYWTVAFLIECFLVAVSGHLTKSEDWAV